MEVDPSDQRVTKLREIVSTRLGLHFPQERSRELVCGIEAAATELGFSRTEACLKRLVSTPWSRRETEILAKVLTVGETYFFRDPKVFDHIRKEILLPLILSRQKTDRRIRIWSAGCASGEEAYSLAILLDRCLPDAARWEVTILATDINEASLRKGREGIYSRWSFRGSPSWLRNGYFQPAQGGRLQIDRRIREMVKFSPLNLAHDPFPDAMDLILCRNVLMYLQPELIPKIVDKFSRSLIEGGWLLVSACETFPALRARFEAVVFPEAFFYRKSPRLPDREQNPAVSGMSPVIDSGIREITPATPGRDEEGPLVTSKPQSSPEAQPGKEQSLESAATLFREGRYEDAAAQVRAALENPPQLPAMALLARILANQGKLAEAAAWCDKLILADKLNPQSHYLQGMILFEKGECESAAAAFERALYLDPHLPLAHFALSRLWGKLGRSVKAQKHRENARALLTRYSPAEILPGSDGLAAGRMLETITDLEKREE